MPVTLPNLDDRKYADLIEEALAMIPAHAPEWTNHNPSDPGITLVELFAYLTEMLIYRLNRVTVENVIAFLNLIDAGNRTPDRFRDRARLTEEVRKVVLELRKPYRTITPGDFNEAVTKDFSKEVARAFTTVEQKPRFDDREVGFISVFAVPAQRSTVLVKKGEEYGDHSSDLRKPGNIAFRLVSEPGEYIYIGMESPFNAIRFQLAVTASLNKLTFEYFKGGGDAAKPEDSSQWAKLTEMEHRLADLTSNWASSGLVVFEPPGPEVWKQATIYTYTKPMYWVRVSAEKPPTNRADATAFQVDVYSAPVLPPDDASDQSLTKRIKKDLDARRLLATRVSVTGPSYKRATVRGITLHLKPDAREADVLKDAKEELSRFFHPLIGGRDGKGWPFGRAVYLSEIIERLVGLPGVDFVKNVDFKKGERPLQIISPLDGRMYPQTGESINLLRFELVDFRITDSPSDPMFITQVARKPGRRQQDE